MELHLVQNQKENCHHDHIPFNVKGNENIVFSVQTHERICWNCKNKQAKLTPLGIVVPPYTPQWHVYSRGIRGASRGLLIGPSWWKKKTGQKLTPHEKSQFKLVHVLPVNWLISTRYFCTNRSALSLTKYTASALVHLRGFKLVIEPRRFGKIIFLRHASETEKKNTKNLRLSA